MGLFSVHSGVRGTLPTPGWSVCPGGTTIVGERPETRARGLLYGLAAYAGLGLMPLYFKAAQAVWPMEMLAHRIVWCVLLLVVVLTLQQRWQGLLRCMRNRRLVSLLLISSVLVGTNWLVYIYGVSTGRVMQASLGYFINPLLSVLLGVVFFRERLRPCQVVAVGLAALGVVYHVCGLGQPPWIALAIAGSFGLYGLVRKVAPVDAVVGLTVETLLLLPAALGFLAWQAAEGGSTFGQHGLDLDVLVMLSGVVTAVPLLCFGAAARRLPLSTLGFVQYLAPSMQLGLAVWRYQEPFQGEHAITFGLIWAGLAVFSVEAIVAHRRLEAVPTPEPLDAAEKA
jgi:chloramphenicol-sensitive protein RarD